MGFSSFEKQPRATPHCVMAPPMGHLATSRHRPSTTYSWHYLACTWALPLSWPPAPAQRGTHAHLPASFHALVMATSHPTLGPSLFPHALSRGSVVHEPQEEHTETVLAPGWRAGQVTAVPTVSSAFGRLHDTCCVRPPDGTGIAVTCVPAL